MPRALSILYLAVIGLLGCGAARQQPPATCLRDDFDGQAYTVCAYRSGGPKPPQFRLAWKGPDGRPLGGLPALRAALGPEAGRVAFAMNAGMYHPGQRPVGLLVERGATLSPLETRAGTGNFYDRPGGVFWIDAAGRPHLEETAAFATAGRRPVWATQSGPLLLQGGRMHPITARASHKAVRNGVILCGPDRAEFVISDGPVTLGQFARYARDGRQCRDLLYLDGAVSVLWSPELGRLDARQGLGPLLLVLKGR